MAEVDPRASASRVAPGMYVGEPCRVCGSHLTREDMSEAVFAGYSRDNKARAAHGLCWERGLPQELWAYPEDALRQ